MYTFFDHSHLYMCSTERETREYHSYIVRKRWLLREFFECCFSLDCCIWYMNKIKSDFVWLHCQTIFVHWYFNNCISSYILVLGGLYLNCELMSSLMVCIVMEACADRYTRHCPVASGILIAIYIISYLSFMQRFLEFMLCDQKPYIDCSGDKNV